jgi:GTP-binding protein HflX
VSDLLHEIDRRLAVADEVITLEVPSQAGALISWLHRNSEVLNRATTDDGRLAFRVRVDAATRAKLTGQMKRAGLDAGRATAGAES